MSAPIDTRRNNPNSSLQVQDDHRALEELRLQAQPRIELARGQLSVSNVVQGQAATLSMKKYSQPVIDSHDRINADHFQQMEADRVRRRSLREAAAPFQMEPEATANAARTASMSSPTTVESTPVMDMFFCLDNLLAIRAEAGDFTLKDFSDYWAADNVKTAPNQPRTFEPTRLVRGNHPLWASFYNPGRTRLGDDGTVESDPNHRSPAFSCLT
jgi:hypothetical protein